MLGYASSMFGLLRGAWYRMKNEQIPSKKIQSTLSTCPRSFDARYVHSQEYIRRHNPSRR